MEIINDNTNILFLLVICSMDGNMETTNGSLTRIPSNIDFGYLAMEGVLFFLGLAGIICSSMTILAIYKLKHHKKPKGFYLVLLSFYSIVYLMMSPVDRYMVRHFNYKVLPYTHEMCFVYDVVNCCLVLMTALHFLLGIDWVLYNFCYNKYLIYENRRLLVEVCVFIACFLISVFLTVSCMNDFNMFTAGYCMFYYLLLIFLITLHIIKIVWHRTRGAHLTLDYSIVLPTIFVIFWFPNSVLETYITYQETTIASDVVVFVVTLIAQIGLVANIVFLSNSHHEYYRTFNDIVNCKL